MLELNEGNTNVKQITSILWSSSLLTCSCNLIGWQNRRNICLLLYVNYIGISGDPNHAVMEMFFILIPEIFS